MANTYTPAANSVASRVVAWLHARPSGEYNAAQIAEALKVDPKIIASSLEVALREKLVFHRQRVRTSPRAPWWYSARDREEHARRNGFAAAATWMPAPKINRKDAEESGSSPGTPGASGTPEVSSASSAEAAAADAPSGDEGAAADADRAAAPAPDTSEGLASQQVLKAEAARPDATAREATSTGSPGVGPMGAGQPADAGPTTDESAAQQGTNPVRRVGPAASTPAALPPVVVEQRREVDEQFAASLRAAFTSAVDDAAAETFDQLAAADLAATRRAIGYDEHGGKRYCRECGQRENQPHLPKCSLAFRAARFSDGSLATERDGMVVAVYSAAEVDAIQKLLGVRG